MNEKIGKKCQLVGDDLFVTSVDRLKKGIKENCANSILIKLNQIGTLSETIETINEAKKNNFNTIISHRSGETENFHADLAVGADSGQIKTGSLSRTERIAKYNQLLKLKTQMNQSSLVEKIQYKVPIMFLNKNNVLFLLIFFLFSIFDNK